MAAYLAANAGFKGLGTGALVFFSPDAETSSNSSGQGDEEATAERILLVQRAAHDSMPLRWEDETILHAVARELREESGLRAAHIGPQVGEPMAFFTRRGRRMLKLSFLVDVEAGADGQGGKKSPPVVKLDPEEHAAFFWATEEECRRHRVGETDIEFTHISQEQTILEGFRLRRELRRQAPS
ncbi:NUDIX domain-containing protein [Apiospora aurea]|uniref:NUDIX domain-containing protein n=1 Tax=Apiospora aurea TaxID=335848 RepID=A0ABR1QXC3_9PEZI